MERAGGKIDGVMTAVPFKEYNEKVIPVPQITRQSLFVTPSHAKFFGLTC